MMSQSLNRVARTTTRIVVFAMFLTGWVTSGRSSLLWSSRADPDGSVSYSRLLRGYRSACLL